MSAPTIQDVVNLTNRRPQPVEKVLGRLGCTSKRLRALIEEGTKKGYEFREVGGMLHCAVAVRGAARVVMGDARPGRKQVFYFTDTHFGCRHCAEDDLVEHLQLAWERGCRHAICTGDVLDGNRPVLLQDQDYVGFDGQAARLVRSLRQGPPFEVAAIDGNHDGYFSASVGSPCGALVSATVAHQHPDVRWRYAGNCEGRVTVHGADWFLWHPHGGSTSREGVRRVIEGKARGLQERVDVVAMGHLHKWVAFNIYPENIFAVCGGTYQRQKSEFSNRMSDPWDVGGMIVSWDLDKEGRCHAFAAEPLPARAL